MSEQAAVVVMGGINSDFLVKGARLPRPGESVLGRVFQEGSGGKGANQAVAASRLGARALLIGKVGTDERGDRVLRRLAAEDVDVLGVKRDDGASTGAAVVVVDDAGEKQIMAALGANGWLSEADVEAAKDAIASANVLLAQLEVPVPAVHQALRLAKGAGLTTVLDPAPAVPLPDDLLRLVDVIRPNASEAETLTGVAVRDRASAKQAAGVLLERGVPAAVVQAGDEGDLLVARDEEILLPRHHVDSVDATGAGRRLCGGSGRGSRRGAAAA